MPGHTWVRRYLGRLRRRAAVLHSARALIATSGATACAFSIAALTVGPAGHPANAVLGWVAVAAAAALVLRWAWATFSPLRGAGVCSLLGQVNERLPSATRSALELGHQAPTHASSALVAAHHAQVRRLLGAIAPSTVVRWDLLRHPIIAWGVAGLLVSLALLSSERGAAGAYTLLHPGAHDAGGARMTVAFGSVEAHLVYPSYLARPSETVDDPTFLEVPVGTSVELRARPRFEISAGAVQIAERQIEMERDDEGRLYARFVVRDDCDIRLRGESADGDSFVDARTRRVRALVDEAPEVELLAPAEAVLLESPVEVPVVWNIRDDIGVASVDLVIRRVDGEEQRRRVGSFAENEHRRTVEGESSVDTALLSMEPGDTVTVWIEAMDGDVVTGPKTGRSRQTTITLASEANLRQQRLASLVAVLDRALYALADRLEAPIPEPEPAARERFAALKTTGQELVDALRAFAERARESGDGRATDIALYRSLGDRLRRSLFLEQRLHGSRLGDLERRTRADAANVEVLEDVSLSLDELVGRARAADAAELARELESLRREIRSLLSELRRSDSAEARAELLTAIGRAQARMRELARRIAEMGTNVPQEFMNRSEMSTEQSASTLASLREAVQRGDLEGADRLANELQHQIDQLARALGQTEAEFTEARFGPRERAMANALERLGELEGEQRALAQRGGDRRGRAAERAIEAMERENGPSSERLAQQAEEVRSAVGELDRGRLASFEQDAYDTALQRLTDTRDALRAGDLGEARRMAEAAALSVSGLSRDLDLSALMFPGAEGETAETAQSMREADRGLRSLRREIDEALPEMAEHVGSQDQSQMRADRERQRTAMDAARALAEAFGAGPDGAPLDEDAPHELGEAARTMEDAASALREGDPLRSTQLQEDAARRVTSLRERLERQQNSGGSGGGDGASSEDFRRPVEIPGADAFEGPMEMRRRILDAMRRDVPDGYEDAVRRYYEGLLR